MLLKIIRFLRGSVDFTASGKFPERFMNITAKNGVNLWNPVPKKNAISASMYLSDYKKIRILARKSRVKTRITARHGLPFILTAIRREQDFLQVRYAELFSVFFFQILSGR